MGEVVTDEGAGRRLKCLVSGLDDRDLDEQAVKGIRTLIEQPKSAEALKLIAKELLSAYVVEKCEERVLFQVVRIVSKQVFRQVGEEKHVGNVHAVGVLMGVVVERIMMQKNISLEGPPDDKSAEVIQDWLFNTLFPGVLRAASRSTDKNSTAMSCSMLHGLLSGLMHWTHLPGVEQVVRCTLESIAKCMTVDSLMTSCSGAYPPIQRCIEILGVHAPSQLICAALDVCLLGAKEKTDFQARRSAFDTITTIVASAQVQVQNGDHWELKSCPVLTSVMRRKKKLKKALDNAKYDKILLVRKAASLAALEVENIPDVPVSTSMDGFANSISSRKASKNEVHNRTRNLRSLSASAIQLPAAQESDTILKERIVSKTVSKTSKIVECRQSRLSRHQSAGATKEQVSSTRKPENMRAQISPSSIAHRKVKTLSSRRCTERSQSIAKVEDGLTTKSCSVSGDSGQDNDAPTTERVPLMAGVRKAYGSKTKFASTSNHKKNLTAASKLELNTPEQLDICQTERTSSLPKSSKSRRQGVCSIPTKLKHNGVSIDCEALLDRTIVTLRECMEGLPGSFGEGDILLSERSKKMLVQASGSKKVMGTVMESENTGKESDGSTSLVDTLVVDPNIKSGVVVDDWTERKESLLTEDQDGLQTVAADEAPLLLDAKSDGPVQDCKELTHPKAAEMFACPDASTSVAQRMEPCVAGTSPKQDVALQKMLSRSTTEIQDFYKKQERLHLEFLDMQMERSIAVMKALIEHEKSIVQAATQHALSTELNMFNERFRVYAQPEKNDTMIQDAVTHF